MELSLKVSGKHLVIATAIITTLVGMGLGYRSYSNRKANEAALAAFNQQAAAFDRAFAADAQQFEKLHNLATSESASGATDAAATAAAAADAAAGAAASEAAAAAEAATTNSIHQ